MTPAALLAVALGGGLGAVSRYVAVLAMRAWFGASPWPIAVVNVVGCCGFGLCWALQQHRWSPTIAAAVLAGFFGAFTTFSAFAGDCHTLLAERRFVWLAANIVLQNLLGVIGIWGGIAVGTGLRA